MAKIAAFEYFKSKSRKSYLAKKRFPDTLFFGLSFINLLIFILALFLVFRPELLSFSRPGYGQIILALSLLVQSIFLGEKYATANVKQSDNPIDQFDLDLIDFFEKVILEARRENVKAISPEYIFQKAFLVNVGQMLFLRLGIAPEQKSNAKPQNFSVEFNPALIEIITNLKSKKVVFEDLMAQIVATSESVKGFLQDIGLEQKEVLPILWWLKNLHQKPQKFYEDNIISAGIGQDWSYGYSPILSRYSFDISKYFSDSHIHLDVFGRKDKIDEMQAVLARPGRNSVLLVGEPGVGKKTIVNALALKMSQGESLPALHYKRIKQLDVGRLLSGAGRGELEARIDGALNDAANAGNIILYIDNFQSLLGGFEQSREEVGGIDASQFLLPYLGRANFQIIASVTPEDYFSRVRANSAIAESFEKIEIDPATPGDTFSIMLELLPALEGRYKTIFTAQTLKEIIKQSDRFMHDVPFPEKALRLMQEVAVSEAGTGYKILGIKDIDDLISRKTHVPIGEAQTDEKDKLLHLEEFLHQRVISQDEAIRAVADALRRTRSGLTSGKRPVGVFLFLGPTGVGKTETAKALAESYFNSEKEMIRLDMSEYIEATSLDRLIGTVQNPNGVLTTAISEKPFSLILLDELEKADKNILNLFLQIFEDGRLTDPRGKVLDFTNAIIIATSNAGSEMIREKVAASDTLRLKENLIESLQEQAIFTPEFLNRFDDVIVFKPLTEVELQQVATLMIAQLNLQLKDKNITVVVAPEALAKLSKLGYDPQFGARPMRRVIQEKVENLLAKKMLSGEVKDQQTVNIGLDDIA